MEEIVRSKRGVNWVKAIILATITVGAATTVCAQTADLPETPAIYVLDGDRPQSVTVEIPLGATRNFTIANAAVFHVGSFEPFQLRNRPSTIRWSLEPAGKGVGITHPASCRSPRTQPPACTPIRAEIPGGMLTRELQVYDPRRLPLVGTWREAVQIACNDSHEFEPATRMGELVFEAGGHFTATWRPFETRIDYSGRYEFEFASERLTLTLPADRRNTPPDISPSGTAAVDTSGRLILKGIWLGTPAVTGGAGASSPPVRACGHVFVH